MGTQVPPHSPKVRRQLSGVRFFLPSRWVKASLVSIVLRRVLQESWLEIVSESLLFRPQDWWDDRWCHHTGLFLNAGFRGCSSCQAHLPSYLSGLTLFPQSQSLLWSLELTNSAGMAAQQGARILLSLPPSARMTGLQPIPDLIRACWRSKPWLSCLCSKYFNNTNPPPQPSTRHWKQTFMLGVVGWWWSLHIAWKALGLIPSFEANKQAKQYLFISKRATFPRKKSRPKLYLKK